MSSSSASGRPRVLVVEPFLHLREMYAEYLHHCGFAVAQASGGAEAARKCAASRTDLVLLDLALPEVDGCEAARRIRANAATRDVAIIAFTSHELRGSEEAAFDAGCDGWCSKPHDLEALVRDIRRTLASSLRASVRRRRSARAR